VNEKRFILTAPVQSKQLSTSKSIGAQVTFVFAFTPPTAPAKLEQLYVKGKP
jgi:hypothetical protein